MEKRSNHSFFYCIKPAITYFLVNMGVSVAFAFLLQFYFMKDSSVSDIAALYDAVYDYTLKYSVWISLACAVITAAILYPSYRKKEHITFEGFYFNRMGFTDIVMMIFTGIGIYMLIDVMLVILSGIINMSALLEEHSQAVSYITGDMLIAEIAVYGIIIPFTEEMMFRGMIFNRLRYLMPPKRAIIVSALIFGSMHYGSLLQMIYAAGLGAAMAYAYYKYANLAAPVLIHTSFNLMNYLLSIPVLAEFFGGKNNTGNAVYYALTVILAISCAKHLVKKKRAKRRVPLAHEADNAEDIKMDI